MPQRRAPTLRYGTPLVVGAAVVDAGGVSDVRAGFPDGGGSAGAADVVVGGVAGVSVVTGGDPVGIGVVDDGSSAGSVGGAVRVAAGAEEVSTAPGTGAGGGRTSR